MRFRSSYSCGAAEDFPSITTSPAILDCRSFDFAQDSFGFNLKSKIKNRKLAWEVAGAGDLFPLHPAAVNKFSVTGSSVIENCYRQDENRREYESSFPQLSHHSGLG